MISFIIRMDSPCKKANHVISVGAISFLIYKPKSLNDEVIELIEYCIDMDSLDGKKITYVPVTSHQNIYIF